MDKLFQVINQGAKEGRLPVGYTVTSYQGVLQALQQDKTIVIDKVVWNDSPAGTLGRYFTVLGDSGISDKVKEYNGFLHNEDDTPLYQAFCNLKDYMSFPVTVKTSDGQTKGYASVNKGVHDGCTQKPGVTYPPSNLDGNAIERLKDSCTTCYVGVGMCIDNLATQFFKHFYQDLNLTSDKVGKIASLGHLYAEILVPQGRKGSSGSQSVKVLHAKVTVNKAQSTTGSLDIWMPIPLLLLNDFNSIADVKVDAGIGKGEESVGKGNVTFPLASSRYYHKTGELTGLTPEFLDSYDKEEKPASVSYKRTTLCSQGRQTHARVRLYFDEAARSQLGEISQEYAKNLFRGTLQSGAVTQFEEVRNAALFNNKGHVILDVGHVRGYNDNSGVTNRSEYDFNYDYVQAIYNLLQQKGISVGVIDYPSMGNFEEINRLNREIKASGCMILICVHNNAAVKYGSNGKPLIDSNGKQIPDPRAHGGCCVMPTNTQNPSLDRQLTETFAHDIARIMPGRSGGAIQQGKGYGITRGLSCAVGYLECGFYTNPDDVKKMTKGSSQFQELTQCVANGIEKFYNKYKK